MSADYDVILIDGGRSSSQTHNTAETQVVEGCVAAKVNAFLH